METLKITQKKDKCIEREKRTKVIGANAILEVSQCSLRRQMSVRNDGSIEISIQCRV